jgi:hypothetical protein
VKGEVTKFFLHDSYHYNIFSFLLSKTLDLYLYFKPCFRKKLLSSPPSLVGEEAGGLVGNKIIGSVGRNIGGLVGNETGGLVV